MSPENNPAGSNQVPVNPQPEAIIAPQAATTSSTPATTPSPSNQTDRGIYPSINISLIQNPSRFYAVPIIGILVKIIILIPVWFWILILSIVSTIVSLINSFVVIFTGKYWEPAFRYNLGLIRLAVKLTYFLSGLTNKYPGFSLSVNDNYTVDIIYPEYPNRLFAIPFFGGLIRIILLIPYFIYHYVRV